MLLTLAQARPVLWRYASNVPYSTASDDDIKSFDDTLNRLLERLLIEGKWRSCFRRVTLQTYENTLTLPRNLSTCLGCDPICSTGGGGFPLNIYSRWFEFAASGPGLTSDSARACAIRGLIPVSDSAQTFVDPTGTFYLKAVSSTPSGRGITLVGGLDENGNQIDGEVKLEINGTTTQKYTSLPFIKKAITGASVLFGSVDTTTAEETILCVYAPSETVPQYKRYVIPSASDGDTFACLCKLAFVPAINDSDLIIPSVTDALVTGLQAFQFRDRNDKERFDQYMADAIYVLDTDRAEDDSAEIPVLNFPDTYGAGNIYQVH